MGMHWGVIAARASADRLLDALGDCVGAHSAVGEMASLSKVPSEIGDRAPLVIGTLDGVGFVFDPSMLISDTADCLINASGTLDTVVASISGETTSGTYSLTVAERGTLRRLHRTSLWGLPAPYDIGEPLPAEGGDRFDDIDGVGLRGILTSLGFPVDGWLDRGPFTLVGFDFAPSARGPVGQALHDHYAAHSTFDPSRIPTPVVVQRGAGFDIVAAGSRLPDGSVVREAPGRRRSFLGRLLGR